jgi:hypothetical protein
MLGLRLRFGFRFDRTFSRHQPRARDFIERSSCEISRPAVIAAVVQRPCLRALSFPFGAPDDPRRASGIGHSSSDASFKSPDISLSLVLTMCAVGIALSLVSLILAGWVFQPSDVTL